jgi:hypothetical protein
MSRVGQTYTRFCPFDSRALSELKCARNPRFVPTPSELAILDQLSDNGHVIMPNMHSNEGNAELVFAMIGRNKATTFTRLCGHHDARIFEPIDKSPNIGNT